MRGTTVVLLVSCVTLLGSCDFVDSDRTRVPDAVLSAEALAAASSSTATQLPTSGSFVLNEERCTAAQAALRQLENLGPGAFRVPSAGVMEIDERVWVRLPAGQRQNVLNLLVQAKVCASQSSGATDEPDTRVIVREINSGAVLQSYEP